MGITVQHQPSFASVGEVSRGYGDFKIKREDKLRAEDTAIKFNLMNKEAALNEQQAKSNFERQKYLNEQQAESNFERQKDLMLTQFDLNLQADELKSQRDLEKSQDLMEVEYTTKQRMMIDNINNQIQDVQLSSDLSPEDKAYAIRELEFQKAGVKPNTKPRTSEFPKGQDIGQTWEDPKYPGTLFTRNKDGQPEVLLENKDNPELSIMERMSPKDYSDLYQETYKSMVTKSSNPLQPDSKPDPKEVDAQVRSIIQSQDNMLIEAQSFKLPSKFKQLFDMQVAKGKNPRLVMKQIKQLLNSMQRKNQNG